MREHGLKAARPWPGRPPNRIRGHGRLAGEETIFHSARGSQHTSSHFQQWCAGNGLSQSMGKVGVCWDNAFAENVFSHLKTWMYHHQMFASRLAARTAVMDYVEAWDNRRRPNRRAGGIPPVAAHAVHQARDHEPMAA
jgi:transposase InsO family protein